LKARRKLLLHPDQQHRQPAGEASAADLGFPCKENA
jgi:hypothetical protein